MVQKVSLGPVHVPCLDSCRLISKGNGACHPLELFVVIASDAHNCFEFVPKDFKRLCIGFGSEVTQQFILHQTRAKDACTYCWVLVGLIWVLMSRIPLLSHLFPLTLYYLRKTAKRSINHVLKYSV